MSFEFACEACGAKLRIGDESAGKEVKCPKCSAIVLAKAVGETQASASPFARVEPGPGSMDDVNPYAAPPTLPEIDVGEQAPPGTQEITPGIRRAMSQTRPWVLFLSILGFIGGGLMVLAGVGMSIGSLFTRQPVMVGVGAAYLVYAALYLACSYYLFLYGQRIGALQRSNHVRDLEAALVAQKSFWTLVGVLVAVMLVLGLLMVVAALLLPAVMAGANV